MMYDDALQYLFSFYFCYGQLKYIASHSNVNSQPRQSTSHVRHLSYPELIVRHCKFFKHMVEKQA